jgi:hypothetical protein
MICPNKDICELEVKKGKVFCKTHQNYLHISCDWENKGDRIDFQHIIYVAYSNGKEQEVLIEEEGE